MATFYIAVPQNDLDWYEETMILTRDLDRHIVGPMTVLIIHDPITRQRLLELFARLGITNYCSTSQVILEA